MKTGAASPAVAAERRALQPPMELDALRLPIVTPPPPPWRGWRWLTGLGLLVLLTEAFWLSRAHWLAQGPVRNALTPVFARAGEALERPVLNNVWQVQDLQLDAVPDHPGSWTLRARLTLVADILQPAPTLQLTFRDWQGQLAGEIRLRPTDYRLAGAPPARLLRPDRMLPFQATVHQTPDANGHLPHFERVTLEVVP